MIFVRSVGSGLVTLSHSVTGVPKVMTSESVLSKMCFHFDTFEATHRLPGTPVISCIQ